jgi:hypothetical protein
VSGQLHALAALPPGKSPRYPLERRLGGPQSRSGRSGEEKILEAVLVHDYKESIASEVKRRREKIPQLNFEVPRSMQVARGAVGLCTC